MTSRKSRKPGKYKVCILAAGVGSQMGEFAENINKAVLPVNNKAVISYIVEKFPKSTEFVIAVGHKKETVTDYLSLAHPERKFKFVTIDKYSGPGTGPGYSILKCEKYLKSPFIFFTADTMVLEDIPAPESNWMGIAPVKETERYCTVKLKNNLIYQLDDKIKTDNKFAFIGLAGIKDYGDFFAALKKERESTKGEVQVVAGFKGLIEKKLTAIGFTWFDTGSLKGYSETNKNFSGGEKKFDFSKGDEFLYFVNGRAIKFFVDSAIAHNRFERAKKYLKGLAPKMEAKKGGFYAYKMVPGQTIYNTLSRGMVRDFLAWARKHLWKPVTLNADQKKKFDAASLDFYKHKTLKRVEAFAKKTGMKKERTTVNGVEVPTTAELLKRVDWNTISRAMPSLFHGDLQFDNVLSLDKKNKDHPFMLLDWRQDFGGLISVGDLYYDLAKLYGGTIISYPLIKDGMFTVSMNDTSADYKYFIKSDSIDAREELEDFILKNGYDLKKIQTLTALIFLNMAPLHNEPFDLLLHHMGRSMLHKALG
ncbi:NTP transferase domain-containing protein [Candidatus Kaiserbacteria bacterium]|nr:NTP transferase domain-containing protein [Candidatus Kaiserbacteria bacterium]